MNDRTIACACDAERRWSPPARTVSKPTPPPPPRKRWKSKLSVFLNSMVGDAFDLKTRFPSLDPLTRDSSENHHLV